MDEDTLAERLAARLGSRDRPLYTAVTLAKRLSLSPRRVRELLARGDIPSIVIGDGSRRIDPADVDAYLRARREEKG